MLKGSIDGIIDEANACLGKGVYGFDLLAYRYEGDPSELIRRFVGEVPAPVCIAGSVDREARLEELRDIRPWGFTIGGAIFDHRVGDAMPRQIDKVISFMEDKPGTDKEA